MAIRFRGRLPGYLLGRASVLLALVALAGVFQARSEGFPVPFEWFSAVTACSFAFTLVSILALRSGPPGPLWLKAQPTCDVAYATVLVYLSGGAFSPFASLYPLAIIGAAILLYRRGALVLATASSLTYGLLVALQALGAIVPLNPFPLTEAWGGKLFLQLLFNVVAFYAVALLSGFLAEELRQTGARLEEVREEVLNLEHLKESILHSLGSGLVALDDEGREVFHNQAAEDLLERAGIALGPGMDFAPLFDLRGGERSETSFREGSVTLGYSVSPLFDREGPRRGDILIFQDVTRIKRLQEDLRRADRLAAVGRLAAGLAHEIRNPLASLAGSVEVLRRCTAPDGDEAALFDIVLKETDRLNRLVTNFLHYARPGRVERSAVDLRALVAEMGFFFTQGDGRKRFTLFNDVPDGFRLEADHGQMEQLLLNLFRNSVESAPGEVNVTVTAQQNGSQLHFTVRDDGPGMPPEVAEHAFEPFVSGKTGGTGLGLATVHRVVQNHEGSVVLDTSEGRGTAFHFHFPAG